MDAVKNFAYSTVLTPPSPGASGTTLVLASGDGAKFPAVPFNAIVSPVGVLPLASNSEIVRVTALATDTLTLTRTQEGSSARAIVAGDQVFVGVTAKMLTDLANPYIAGRQETELYDDFSRYADGSIAGALPLIGPAWSVSGTGVPTVASGLLGSSSVGYAYAILADNIAVVSSESVWSGSGINSGLAMVVSKDASLALANLVHIVFAPMGANIQIRADTGSFDTLSSAPWTKPLRLDGVTKYRISVVIRDDTVIVLGPNGETLSVTDPRIRALRGKLVYWEPLTSGGTVAKIASVSAITEGLAGIQAPLDAPGMMSGGGQLRDQNGRVVGNPNTINEVAIGYSPAGEPYPGIIFGPSNLILTSLRSAVSIGGTSIATDFYIPNGATIQIESGTNSETVTATASSTGSAGSGSYTTPVTALTKNHAAYVGCSVTPPASVRQHIYSLGFALVMSGPLATGGALFLSNSFTESVASLGSNVVGMGASNIFRNLAGATGSRPSAASAGAGAVYYDTTLKIPVWSDGTSWLASQVAPDITGFFGDGVDGALTLQQTTAAPTWATKSGSGATTTFTLSRDVYATTFDMDDSAGNYIVVPNGYRIFASVLLTIDAGVTVNANGGAGVADVAGAGAAGQIYGPGGAGSTGATNTTATQATTVSGSWVTLAVAAVPSGGAGGGTTAGTGNGVAGATVAHFAGDGGANNLVQAIGAIRLGATSRPQGGGGGTGGNATGGTTAKGGGGGGGGGFVAIIAKRLVNNGNIQARGGAGGNAALGNGTAAGGGGGGGGGAIILVYGPNSTLGTLSVAGGNGGTAAGSGGTGGTGVTGVTFLHPLSS